MAKTEPFEKYTSQYEDWFERNRFVYESEIRAIREQLPERGQGIEIGVGSGRFAVPLGIRLGLEPSGRMRDLAQNRGIETVAGVAERLPFRDTQFDFALMVTTICFLDDVETAFKEAYRVLRPAGHLIIGFVDKDSAVGRSYQQNKNESVFYGEAIFYSVDEVNSQLKETGFRNLSFTQTVFHKLAETRETEPTREGYGEGSFVVVKAAK